MSAAKKGAEQARQRVPRCVSCGETLARLRPSRRCYPCEESRREIAKHVLASLVALEGGGGGDPVRVAVRYADRLLEELHKPPTEPTS